MQSRLATTAARRSTSFFSSQCLFRRGLASSTDKRTADPSVHAVDFGDDLAIFSGNPEETQNVAEPKPAKQETKTEYKASNGSDHDPLSRPKSPHATSSRLQSSGVNHPFDPTLQQKRSYGGLENVRCVGFDGTPNDKKENQRNHRSGGAQQKHDKDFFNNHNKASETEDVADTRKPITRSTEGPAYYSLTKDVIGWKPEQLDSADGALKRARKLFEESAERGVPEHPHSKVLRELRGESF